MLRCSRTLAPSPFFCDKHSILKISEFRHMASQKLKPKLKSQAESSEILNVGVYIYFVLQTKSYNSPKKLFSVKSELINSS